MCQLLTKFVATEADVYVPAVPATSDRIAGKEEAADRTQRVSPRFS